MERLYGEKSYRPSGFEIDYWGYVKVHPNEYREFKTRRIKGNILLAAYYSPVTIQEISIELGVALPYLEDEIKLLVDRQYLVCNNGKYLTNIPIFTLDCTKMIEEKLRALTEDTAKKLIAAADEFDSRFGERFSNENLARWQKLLLCLHYSLLDTEGHLKSVYGKTTDNRLGMIWGRSFETSIPDALPQGLQGIYNGCQSSDKQGSVIAINFRQTLNAQHFEYSMTNSVVCTAMDCYAHLPKEQKERLDALGYAKDGKANFAVWTIKEYDELRKMLGKCIAIVSELSHKTSALAASVTADLAPAHIRKVAEYVGASVYRFNSIQNLVDTLFDIGWLEAVDDKEKPAVCVVKD